MKKWNFGKALIAFLAVLVLIFGLIGCSGQSASNSNTDGSASNSVPADTSSDQSVPDQSTPDQSQPTQDQSSSTPQPDTSSGYAGNFDIRGVWKAVGGPGWGQAQPGAVVRFADGQCNLFSPADTYALEKSGSGYVLDVTGVLGSGGSLTVKLKSKDLMDLYDGDTLAVELQRVG